MASSKDTKRLGYHKLVYNLDSNKFFYDQPGDQFKEVDLSIETEGGSFAGDVLIGGSLPSDPNITLHASGDADFKGQIDVGFLDIDSGIRLDPAGTISVRGDSLPSDTPAIEVLRGGSVDGNQNFIVQLDGEVRIGSNAYTSPDIILHTDGTGEFHNNITVGDYPQNGALIREGYGFVGVRNDSASDDDNAYCFAAFRYGTGFDNANIWFKNDGSAYFAGTVTMGGAGGPSKIQVDQIENRPDSQDPWLTGVNSSSVATFELYKNGNVTSAGTITAGGKRLSGDASGTTSGVVAEPNGIITINNGGSVASSTTAFDIQYAGTSVGSVKYDGSALFAGDIESNNGTDYSSIRNGYIVIGPSTSSFGQVFGCIPADVGSYTSRIYADGSARFAGDVRVGGLPTDGSANGSIVSANGGFVTSNSDTTIPLWSGYTTGNATATSTILADGSASFESITVNTSLSTGAAFISDRTATNLVSFQANLNGSPTAEIFAGGSATFSNYVDFTRAAVDGESYVGIGPGGSNEKAQFINRSGEVVLELYDDYSGSENISLKGDGSANFAGGNISLTSTGNAVFITSDAAGTVVDSYAPSGSTGNVFRGWLDTTTTSTIKSDGTADFAGKVTCAPTEMTDADNTVVTKKFFLENSGGIVGGGNLNLTNLTVSDVSTLGNGNFIVSADGSLVSTADATFANGKISLNDDGSAEYEGRILVGTTDITQPASTVDVGTVTSRNVSNAAIWEGTIINNASPTSQILADGSTSFAGNMEIRNNSTLRIRATNNDAATAIELEDSGEATFTGNIFAKASDNEFSQLEPSGVLKLQTNQSSMAGADAVQVTYDGDQVIQLKYDGTASFFKAGTGGDTVVAVKGGAAASDLDYKIQLKNDGSALFTGQAQVGGSPVGASQDGTVMQPSGSIVISQGDVNSLPSSVLQVYKTGDSNANILLKNDGSATFAGSVTVNDPANTSGSFFDAGGAVEHYALAATADSTPVLSVGKGNVGYAVVTAGGSATFGDSQPWTDTDTKFASYINRNGSIELYNPNNSSANTFLIGYGDGDEKFKITTDGSSTFVGDGTFGSPSSYGSTSGVYIQTIGGAPGAAGLYIYQNGVTDEAFIKGYSNSSEGSAKVATFAVNTDGTASFDGVVTQKGATIKPSNPSGGIYVRNVADDDNVATILGDGSAYFNGSDAPFPTRISKYGSLLVATASDAIGDARCSIDAGNGNITSVGSLDIAGPISPGDGDAGIALVNVSGETGPCLLGTNKTAIDTSRTVNLGAGVQQWNRGYFGGRLQVTNRIEGYAPSDGDYAFSAYGHGGSGNSLLFRGANSGGTEIVSISDNGSATFGNDPTTTASNGIKLAGSTGAISARRTADPANYLFAGYSTVSGNTPVAYISADGSAEFANEIGVGPNYTNSNVNKDGTWISGTGRITFNHSTSQSNTFIRGTKNNGEGGNTEQFAIGDDGSASFAGQTSTISSYAQYSFVTTETTSNTGVFVGSSSQTNPTAANSNIHLQGDGGMLQRATGNGAYVRNQYHADRNEAQSAISTLEGWWDGTKVSQIALATGDDTTNKTDGIIQFFASAANDTITETARFYAGGKANFGDTTFYTADTNFQITNNDSVKLGLSSPGNRSFSLFVNSSGNFSIVDESASENRMTINGSNSTTTFPKTVVVGNNPSGGSLVGVANSFEGYVQATGAVGSTLWYGYEKNGSLNSRIYANGDAEFAGTLSAANFDINSLSLLPS